MSGQLWRNSLMSKYNSLFYKLWSIFPYIVSKIKIGKSSNILTVEDKQTITDILQKEPCVILTTSAPNLSSRTVKFMSKILTGKSAEYTHAVMSYYDYEDDTFMLIESTNSGVHLSTFDEVFSNLDHVCVLEIKHKNEKELDKINKKLKSQLGKKYDNLFDYKNKDRVSCVEVVYHSIKDRQFSQKYPMLDQLIKAENNIVPQMFKDCGDFKILFEK